MASELEGIQRSAFSPPPNMSQEHVREKALYFCEGGREEWRKLDGERDREIRGIDKKKSVCRGKLLEERNTFKGLCRGVFTAAVFFFCAALCKPDCKPPLSYCPSLRRSVQKYPR